MASSLHIALALSFVADTSSHSLLPRTPFLDLCSSNSVLRYAFQSVWNASIRPHLLSRSLWHHPTCSFRACPGRKHYPLNLPLAKISPQVSSRSQQVRRHRYLHYQRRLWHPDIYRLRRRRDLRNKLPTVHENHPRPGTFLAHQTPRQFRWPRPAREPAASHVGGAEYGSRCSRWGCKLGDRV